jgi:PadR family transcriptional regulator
VRTVKTASGARAVQIVHSSRRGSRNIEHIGSAHDDAELELLKAAARQRLAAGQGELDPGLAAAQPTGGGGPLPPLCLLTLTATCVELAFMQRNRPASPQAVNVLRALAADPARWRYGYDLATEVHLKSGSLYPILVRLADRGLLETSWEPSVDSRPPRHLYRLTGAGRDFVAALTAARTDRATAHPHHRLSEA